jgi:ABC-2 type transport system ATP-binding protein
MSRVPPIIRVTDLRKEFRRAKRDPGLVGGVRTLLTRRTEATNAVDGISFSIDPGELVGYLGRNGAGKSTTIKILTGILVPTSGEIVVDGIVPWRERQRNALNIGVVFGQRTQLWWDLPLVESLELIGRMYRLDRSTYERNLARFTELLELGPFLRTPVRQLSLGQRMRGDLAAAILYGPRVLYLDEPTVGLDVIAKERVRSFIEETNRVEHTTIILTTHDLRDVERLCRRLILIEAGRVLFDGAVQELKDRYAPGRVLVLTFESPVTTVELPGATQIKREGPRAWLRFDRDQPVAPLIAAATARYPVLDLAIEEPELEDVVRTIFATERTAE